MGLQLPFPSAIYSLKLEIRVNGSSGKANTNVGLHIYISMSHHLCIKQMHVKIVVLN